jgi:hypothetical protein
VNHSAVDQRTYHLKGSPWSAGVALGQALGERLEENITRYIETGPAQHGRIDRDKLQQGAIPWLRRLPERFQVELEGMAAGANLPLQRLAEWCYVEECMEFGCSSAVGRVDGRTWLARNNDLWAPDMWGYVMTREIDGRIPRIDLGLEGEIFTSSGINREQLWLHYNYLPAPDRPSGRKPYYPCYVLLSQALESCSSIPEVEALLDQYDRDDGMMLFAVDGKIDEFAVIECTSTSFQRRQSSGNWTVGTNHYCTPLGPAAKREDSQKRYQRMQTLISQTSHINPPADLIGILADEGVEVCGESYGTVYAAVACPSLPAIWYTFGGYPAASAGNWQPLNWPW